MYLEEQLRRGLAAFTKAAWPQVEPNRPLLWGFHLDAVCEHLEAMFVHRQLNRLIVEIPPGCTKTKLTGTFLPAWKWANDPNYRWLFVGNNQELTNDESMTCRNLIESDWYRYTFGIPWKLAEDQDAKAWYKNTAGGHRLCKGILSNVTGRKGDAVVVDDANDARKVASEAERKKVNRGYDDGIDNRVIDLVSGPRLVIGQRTAEDDLMGHLKRQGGWEVLTIPEEFDRKFRTTTCIGWTDPRTMNGELLRPPQFGPRQVRDERRKNLMKYQAQHLQKPRSAEGIRFKAKWFRNRWRYDPDGVHIVLSDQRGEYRFHPFGAGVVFRYGTADGAASAKTTANHTAFSGFIITERYDLVWLACERIQLEIPDQPQALQAFYRKWALEFCGVEAEMANVALYQHATRMQMTIAKLGTKGNDKLVRAVPAMILSESGRLWMPDADAAAVNDFPLGEVETELFGFTGDSKVDLSDDVVDTLSYGVEYFNQHDHDGGNTAPTAAPKPSAGGWMRDAEAARGTTAGAGRNPFLTG